MAFFSVETGSTNAMSKSMLSSFPRADYIRFYETSYANMRMWFYALRIVASIFLTLLLAVSKSAGIPVVFTPFIVLMFFEISINFVEEIFFQRKYSVVKLFTITSTLDVLVIITAIYFSGGANSFLWPALFLVVLSKALVSDKLSIYLMLLSIVLYFGVVVLPLWGILPLPYGFVTGNSWIIFTPMIGRMTLFILIGAAGNFYFMQIIRERLNLWLVKDQLEEKNNELQHLKDELEQTVARRTRELEGAKNALESYIGKQKLI
jgi:hypothetical protein